MTVKWLDDIERRDSHTEAGLGMFAVTAIDNNIAVGLYWGNLVDCKGNILIPCERTEAYFRLYPAVKRPFKMSHCATLKSKGSSLMVDGDILLLL